MVVLLSSLLVIARFTSAMAARGNADSSSATAPVTNGVAALVPLETSGEPFAPRLVMAAPGAISPRREIESPRFEMAVGRPSKSQAATGITAG